MSQAEEKQQSDITILYNGKKIVIRPATTGREFGESLIKTHGNESIQILNGLVRVNGTAAQYVLKEIQDLKRDQHPRIDIYG
jgi:hypothetical protein